MSDINITKTIFVDAQPVTPVNKPSSAVENESAAIKVADQKPDSAPAYDNIVAVSNDGDTVQARPESYDRLSDGFVFNKTKEVTTDNKPEDKDLTAPKTDEQSAAVKETEKNDTREDALKDERIKEAIEEAQEKASEAKDILQDQIKEKNADDKATDLKAQTKINYSSMSDSELERMYLTGQISSYAYNQELDSRKDEDNNAMKENKELSDTEVAAQAGLDANESLRQNVTSETFGAGYETKEEQDLVKEALYGKEMENQNNSNAAFEINLTK